MREISGECDESSCARCSGADTAPLPKRPRFETRRGLILCSLLITTVARGTATVLEKFQDLQDLDLGCDSKTMIKSSLNMSEYNKVRNDI